MKFLFTEESAKRAPEENDATANLPTDDELLMWKPISIENHQLEVLRKHINEKYAQGALKSYYDLHR